MQIEQNQVNPSALGAGGMRFDRGACSVLAGCMFSGKTTELLRAIARVPPLSVRAFKHVIDRRYSPGSIVSHAGWSRQATSITAPHEIDSYLGHGVQIVALDEAHFFDATLVEVVRGLVARKIHFILTTLDFDSWGRPFPVFNELKAMADSVSIKTGTCSRCGKIADRTQRLTPVVDFDMVGAAESYEPRCQACWTPPPTPAPE